ncbi:MarR family winged helix-turn-helix transcriptional regulator [Pseudonocardia sp. HH130630-07]|uniref:MarR family winged helix-turn-helix transcriptional regulator n=1 Tax=Pseudonocardia sp. HH130630-07 TaxID=1690815 RepID=UPI000814D7B4|nr:MarR family transcriptional regulator [Pseudonocardia sp. HH130630-07]ANY06851.1 hypothetical protein AFB00_11720 [Pseudonocardia sp. HH130630-07]
MTDASEEPDEPWLSAEQLHQWVSLVAMVTTLPVSLDAQLKRDQGINLFEYHVLVELGDAPGGVRTMSTLASLARGSLSRLSHAVSRLEAAGWVERRACGGAGRRTEALLTAEGRAKLRDSAPGHVREVRRLIIDTLTAEELAHLGHAARRVIAATDPEIAATVAERSREHTGSANPLP